MKVILINGVGGSGKDEFAHMFMEQSQDMCNWHSKMVSSIDPIKKLYRDFFKWTGSKTDGHRGNLNTLKKMWAEVCNGPNEWTKEIIQSSRYDGCDVIFIMVREYESIVSSIAICNLLKIECFTLNVERDHVPIDSTEQKILDGFPKDFQYDIRIMNNRRIEDLNLYAIQLVQYLYKGVEYPICIEG